MARFNGWLLVAVLAGIGIDGCQRETGPAPSDAGRTVVLGRPLSIAELPGIEPPSGVTTAALIRRSGPSEKLVAPGVKIVTGCGPNWCADGLMLDGVERIAPRPGVEDAEGLKAPGAWFERVLRVTWAGAQFVSVERALSEFSGGAHANNVLTCRTYRRAGGVALRLSDLVPTAQVYGIIAKAHSELSEDLEASGFELDEFDFRVDGPGGPAGPLVLCARGPYPSRSGEIRQLWVR